MPNNNIEHASEPKYSKQQMQVSHDLKVTVFSHPTHEWVIDSKNVALGYGCSSDVLRRQLSDHSDEITENKHFLRGVRFSHSDPVNKVYWTKAGVVRLGFHIKSQRAKQFRDWAESVILEMTAPKVALEPVKRRNHNRLSTVRMVSILEEVAKVENHEVRMNLVSLLKGGHHG